MKLLIQLFLQFFHVGVFSFGGGYATLPFLYDIAEKFHWYTSKQLTDMLAISSITPGPVGVNVATFAGFTTKGILGALIATTAVILPSFIIVTIVSKVLDKFRTNRTVQGAIRGIKPAGCALLSAVKINFHLKLAFTWNIDFNCIYFNKFYKKTRPTNLPWDFGNSRTCFRVFQLDWSIGKIKLLSS